MEKLYESLFQPIKIGKVEIKNKIAMAPMGILGLTTPEGGFTGRAIDYYVERAKGGVGLIITSIVKAENEIERLKMPSFPCATLNPPHFIQTATELTERVHAHGAKIFLQLTMGLGRSGAPGFIEGQPVAPSAIPNYWEPTQTCRELTTHEVERIVERFGEAAQIAVESGFDGIEIHAVHEGYLLDQFTIAFFNRRTDKYGGDLRGRLTLPIEILNVIKKNAGRNFPVGLRYSIKSFIKDWGQGGLPGEDFVERGRDVEEGLEAARILEEAGYDELNADCGSYDAWYWAHPPVYQEHGCYLPFSEKLKKVVNIPVIVAGRLEIPELAARALEEGKADMIGIGRGLLTDPHWPKKVMEGKTARIRPCIGCHDGCLGRVFQSKPLSCTVNPATGREKEYAIEPAQKVKNVMIIGGGVAGLEAARVAAIRGHRVILYEKTDRLGGHVIEGSVPDFKVDDRRLLEWYINEINELKVNVRLNTEVTPDMVANEKPDEVVVATGSVPIILDIPGINRDNVVTASGLLLGKKKAGNTVVVLGGGLVGSETALWLAKQGKKVTIVEALSDIIRAGKYVPHMNRIMLIDLLKFHGVDIMTSAYLLEVADGGAVVMRKDSGTRTTIPTDTVVLATGYRPDNTLYRSLYGKNANLYIIGDARDPQNIMNAIWDAYEVARNM